MKLTRIALATALAVGLATPAMAELVFPSLSYRTGPYAPNGIPFADGYSDYFTLVNERDGGIEGVKIDNPECETGYNTTKGVECYESTKGLGSLVYQPLSTGITYQLIPKATEDKVPIHSMGYGRTSAANGKVFEYIFNYPGTYWDAASIIVKYIMSEEGGDISGKKIALVYHNSAYGKEPIRTLEKLSEKHGFSLTLLPVDHPGQEQKATWLQVRRDRPDYVVMWGWGVMNQVAIKEAASIRFPMDHFIGVWWSASENDVLPAGDGADGYKAITFHGVGDDFPIYADLKKFVYDAGKAAGDGTNAGTVLYNRGMVAAMWAVEAARKAMEIHDTKEITPEMMRDGMEALDVDEARLEELGLPGFTVPVKVSCANHGGPGLGAIQQWDAKAKKWSLITDYIPADREVVDPLIEEDSAAYAKEANITPRTCN
ncbi:ABC transporter substrate-binding protein [Rhodobium gokarnense]|uniref:Branched-chain amino acid transport system substrate-binding protein n=1 Tax=Rhodobium gokarnense TaxID=364296 RepID=A0ABT3H6P7_9HYPH|nr:ABC transporter substrate-binding protein [Rhodobium gokarnense]MCW2306058.1 branched-chain amino acid transport system substrate-binding protein [Rhodobium gokarnense]